MLTSQSYGRCHREFLIELDGVNSPQRHKINEFFHEAVAIWRLDSWRVEPLGCQILEVTFTGNYCDEAMEHFAQAVAKLPGFMG